MNNGTGVTILNIRQVQQHFKNLDITKHVPEVRKVLKDPFLKMRREARSNLKAQNSMRTGNLYRGLSVGSKFSKAKGYFSIAFGARARAVNKNKPLRRGKKVNGRMRAAINHFHLVNSGTKRRYHRNFKYVGKVGFGTSDRPNMNPSFKLGFADKAIKAELGVIESKYVNGLKVLYDKIKTPGT